MLLTEDLGKEPNEYQGNWIPHKLRQATEGGVFFAGDSAGHCLPLTAEGIRTALYFGIVLGRELRAVVEGRQTRERAAARYAEFHDSHEWKFRWLLRAQRLLPGSRPPAAADHPALRPKRFVDWSFGHYLRIAPPDFAPPPADGWKWRWGAARRRRSAAASRAGPRSGRTGQKDRLPAGLRDIGVP